MLDKHTFMETLHSVQDMAKASEEPLTREEALQFFKEMDLSEEQKELVYQYLTQPQEEVHTESEDICMQEESEDGTELTDTPNRKSQGLEKSTHFQMYLEEITELESAGTGNLSAWYERLARGDSDAIEPISKGWLLRVIKIAEQYECSNIMLDDLIQEGNIGLLTGLNELLCSGENGFGAADDAQDQWIQEAEWQLERTIREFMEAVMLEFAGDGEQQKSILAKVSLVHEAKSQLTKELGREPYLHELADFTKISSEEIGDILSLVKE